MLMIASCFLWATIIISPCAAQNVVCSNTVAVFVNSTDASLLTVQDLPLPHNPGKCVLFEINPSYTTGLVAVEILEIFDNPPDVQIVATLYPLAQIRQYLYESISNATLLFYIPGGNSPALQLEIISPGGSADGYGFRARISLVDETDCRGYFQCQSNFVPFTTCILHESVCDGVRHCAEGDDEKNCEWCGQSSFNLSVGQTVTISNPDQNSPYVCSWQFHAPPMSRLLVRFTEYVVPPFVGFVTSLKEITSLQGYAPSGNEDLYIFNLLTANASVPRVQTVVDSPVHVYLLHAEWDANFFQNEFLRFHLEVSAFNETVSCASSEFLCDTSIQCISNSKRCDGLPDCDDRSDELGCNGCDSDKFSCVTNSVETCHPSSWLCDSSRHCDNFQDEYGCVPSCGDFKINLAPNATHRVSSPYAPKGYPTNVVCAWLISSPPGTRLKIKTVQIILDYHVTVTVGEGALVDQSGIIWRRQGGTAPLTASSAGHEVWVTLEGVRTMWYGNDGGYIPLKKPHFIVDVSVVDLAETRCSGENQVTCSDGYQCINASDLCDGVIHCSDYSDELSCGHCRDASLPCDVNSESSPCIDKSDICNGKADCTNYTDEIECSNICGSKRHIFLEEDIAFDVSSPLNGLPPPTDCLWIFTTSPKNRILFEVIDQAIGQNDVAVIGDGTEPNPLTEIARFRYSASSVSYLSNGSSMWLTLSATNSMTSYGSFSYQLSTFSDAGSCNVTEFRCSSTVCIESNLHCDGLDSCGDLSDEFGCPRCGNVSTFNTTDNQTHILQKSFLRDQANFPFGTSCLWQVVASPNHRIRVDIQDFSTSPMNLLQFGDGDEISTDYNIASISGTSSVLSLTSKTNSMWIRLASSVGSDDRFTMEIKQFEPVECEEDDFVCPSGLACIHQDEVCDGTPQCPLLGDEYGCGRCEVDEYRCPGKGSICLRREDICNARPDCPDVSDEMNCHPCGKSHLLLSNETAPSLPFIATYHPICVWFVTGDTDSVVFFEFWRIEIERKIDTVIIGNGHDPSDKSTEVVILNDGPLPSVRVITAGYKAWIRVDIHRNENWNRFIEGTISQTHKNSTCMEEEFTCLDQTVGIVCLDKESTCDGEPNCPDETDESICSECGVQNNRVYKEAITLSSPGFPGITPNSITCQWQIIPQSDQFLFARITTFDVEVDFDKVYFSVERDSPQIALLTGLDISWRTFAWKGKLWITMETDGYINSGGFNMSIYHVENVTSELCTDDEFHCGEGFCVTRDSRCNGFRDCWNYEDENECSDVFCPGSYKCDALTEPRSRTTQQPVTMTELATTTTGLTNTSLFSNVSSYQGIGVYDGFFISVVNKLGAGCIPRPYVCDGEDNCKGLDDETECDKKRCPEECDCRYSGENLIVSCTNGWNETTLSNVAVITHSIHVSGSNIISTTEGAFKKLPYLRVLSLSNSKISEVPPRTFDGLGNLLWLDLSNTSLTELKGLAMEELSNLRGITIFDVPLQRIQKNAFAGLSKLQTLILARNFNGMPPLKVDEGAFDGLVDLSVLYVDDHRLCCFFPATIECKTLEPEPPLFVCSELMPNLVLKIFMWILGVSALIGNIFVMVWRSLEDTDGRDSRIVQSTFVFNLAISDSLMGLYMLIIAGADLHFGDRYFEVSAEWQASVLCKVAGFLSIVASEASVFFLTAITIDRFICIVFPFSRHHIRAKSSRIIVFSIWIGTVIVGLVPTILALDPTSDAYGTSDVCIGLPLMTKVTSYETRQQTIDAGGLTEITVGIPSPVGYRASWFFSIALFLGVNLLCFLVILICYIFIFASARSSMKSVRRHKNQDDELRMAMKMAAIVMTDFICWIPVIIMGILSQSRIVEIPPETYAWVVVFILPINSSLNPYLYTISDLCSQRSASKKKNDLRSSNRRTLGNASKTTRARNELESKI
ncbi:uncharacterized protein [Asterias amurensis]|uniref:uncharacterized protein isoform X2 n=1 Tax=Asterias amurensis TaxID=7602 RepID=UPI003AB22982